MKMHKIVAVGILLFTSYSLNAQPVVEWQKSLGGTNSDEANAIHQTSDGGYIVAGRSYSNDGDASGNHGGSDFWVVKLTSGGALDWEKSLGGSGHEVAKSIQQTSDGGYIVVGNSASNDGDVSGNHGSTDYWICKLSSIGAIEWQKSLGGTGDETATFVRQTTSGDYVVAGRTNSTDGNVTLNHGYLDYWILRLSSTGVIVWEKSLGGTGFDYGKSIQETSDGGFIVAGYSDSNDGDVTGNHGSYDAWVVKLTSAGTVFWEKSLGGSFQDDAYVIQETSDGGYILGAKSYSTDGDVTGNHGNGDLWVVKMTSTGVIDWQKCLGGSGYEEISAIQQTSDGGYMVAGVTNSTDGNVTVSYGVSDYWILKLTSIGTLEWEKSLGGGDYDVLYGAQQTIDGGFIVAGWSNSTDGDVTGNHGDADFWVAKLSAVVGLKENEEQAKLSIYPNPAVNQLNLKTTTNLIGSPYTVHDCTGKIVFAGYLNSENTSIELSDLSKGIYVVQIQTVGSILAERFVKQ